MTIPCAVQSGAFGSSPKTAGPLDFSARTALDGAVLPVKHAPTPHVNFEARVARGVAVVISESADLFESRSEARQALFGQDLVAVLEDRVRQLVERQRATQRAVAEAREAVAARDRRIVELDAKLAANERARAELVRRIDQLLAEVDGLIRAGDADAQGDAR